MKRKRRGSFSKIERSWADAIFTDTLDVAIGELVVVLAPGAELVAVN